MRPSLFTVASLASLFGALPVLGDEDTYWPWQTFKSEPSLQPPVLNITKYGPTSPGYLFFDQNGEYAHNYSLFIMTDDGDLVWQGGYGDFSAFKAQELDGEIVITFFNGVSYAEPWGWGYGLIQVLDSAYQSIYDVTVNGSHLQALGGADTSGFESWLDLHEDRITPEGTMLTTAYNVTQANLTSVGGIEDGWVADCVFYEIDIKTNEIISQWNALVHQDQIPLADAVPYYPLADFGANQSNPWGPFHINTVGKLDDGSYLISSREYCSIFLINLDGSVAWTLNGRTGGDFALGSGISFCYQHDSRVRHIDGNTIDVSMFNNDNNGDNYGVNQTTGLFLRLDTKEWTATLIQELTDPNDTIYSASQDNLQVLKNGHSVMGYGSTPRIKEYYPNGSVAMSVGRPNTLPKAVACKGQAGNLTEVYMSWNGATEYTSWKVYSGTSNGSLSFTTEVARTGFESSAKLGSSASYVRVDAYSANTIFGSSSVIMVQDSR
ncbi:Arylsulfotransferase-domain-containing protein [Xylaria digitata]|nr:Arylsulfotransferase-domain-containing protein [Xylaria digitata]